MPDRVVDDLSARHHTEKLALDDLKLERIRIAGRALSGDPAAVAREAELEAVIATKMQLINRISRAIENEHLEIAERREAQQRQAEQDSRDQADKDRALHDSMLDELDELYQDVEQNLAVLAADMKRADELARRLEPLAQKVGASVPGGSHRVHIIRGIVEREQYVLTRALLAVAPEAGGMFGHPGRGGERPLGEPVVAQTLPQPPDHWKPRQFEPQGGHVSAIDLTQDAPRLERRERP